MKIKLCRPPPMSYNPVLENMSTTKFLNAVSPIFYDSCIGYTNIQSTGCWTIAIPPINFHHNLLVFCFITLLTKEISVSS